MTRGTQSSWFGPDPIIFRTASKTKAPSWETVALSAAPFLLRLEALSHWSLLFLWFFIIFESSSFSTAHSLFIFFTHFYYSILAHPLLLAVTMYCRSGLILLQPFQVDPSGNTRFLSISFFYPLSFVSSAKPAICYFWRQDKFVQWASFPQQHHFTLL